MKRLGVFLAVALAAGPGSAFVGFPFKIPNGTLNRCANCHNNPQGGGSRNQFGLAFAANGFEWNSVLASLDSDGDGITNGEELQDASGEWIAGAQPPGDPRLVSSPGRPTSTPGERGLTINEVLLEPASGETQAVEIQNPLAIPVDCTGLYLHAGDQAYQFPSSQPANTTIPAGGQLVILLNSGLPDEPGLLHESPSFGIVSLDAQDYLLLAWAADQGQQFALPQVITDYVEWGIAGQEREMVAVNAAQWAAGLALPTPGPGLSLEFDGIGDAPSDWITDARPTLGQPNVEYLVLGLLGLRSLDPQEVFAPDANGAGVVDVADVVTRLNLEVLP